MSQPKSHAFQYGYVRNLGWSKFPIPYSGWKGLAGKLLWLIFHDWYDMAHMTGIILKMISVCTGFKKTFQLKGLKRDTDYKGLT